MKKLLIPSSIKQIHDTLEYVDGYILSLKNFSVNAPAYFDIDQILELLKIKNKEMFISINKNIHESELNKLKEMLKILEKYDVNGVFYADNAILNMNKKLNLIWAQEHVTTNYNTCNFLSKFGIKGVLVSPELTLREINEIKEDTTITTFMYVFGYLPMFNSFRHTIQNYYDFNNIGKQNGIHKIYKEDKFYPLVDNNLGTCAYSNFILNAIEEYKNSKIEYGIFNSLLIDEEKMIEVLKMFDKGNACDIEKLIDNTSTGFLYKETIYKVK